ncbi:DinB family protein [Nocardioides sp. HDW12B]|uniref:DinB family protein n=1 Tax=Nocardioides sp. HDW12B TaxID=2714939 RepID=UPI00140CE790|nr:DinB family protein [Nocardioides sp. HDW12B]QIK67867.1 DinB family protein [Nocardioides sp. HDW12B]
MTTPSGADDRREFVDSDLRGARFVRSDLSGAVMRSVDVQGLEVDSPWLLEPGGSLLVNGVDVVPLVDAELDRRFPGRELRLASDPAALRAAWEAVERTWAATLARVDTLPAGTVDASVDGEFSFAQTLRHLVMATDVWLGRAILGQEQPFHPLGQPNAEYATDGYDTSVFTSGLPSYDEVLAVRAERRGMVREFIAGATTDVLAETRANPWSPQHPETVLSCLHVILNEEWEHHRYAVRDLDVLARRAQEVSSDARSSRT